MMVRRILAAFISTALTVPCVAAPKTLRPPSLGPGTTLGLDPYVAEYQQKMASLESQLKDVSKAIQAIQIPSGSFAGGLAAHVAIMAQYAAFATLKAESIKTHAKLMNHLKRRKSADLKYGSIAAAAAGAPKPQATGDSTLRPHDDRIFKGPRPGGGGHTASAVSGAAEASSQRPAFVPMTSRMSYSSNGGGVGAGFSDALGPSPAQGGGGMPSTIGVAGSGGGAQSGGGAGMASGGAGMDKSGGIAVDAKPAGNPDPKTLSSSSSDVAQKAAAEKERLRQEKKEAAEKRAADAKAAEEKRQQMLAQAAQAAAQAAGQAAQAASKQQEQGQGGGGGGGGGDQQNFDAAVQAAADKQQAAFERGVAEGQKKGEKKAKEAKETAEKAPDANGQKVPAA